MHAREGKGGGRQQPKQVLRAYLVGTLANGFTKDLLALVVQWNLTMMVTSGPKLIGCNIKVAYLLGGIQNHHN